MDEESNNYTRIRNKILRKIYEADIIAGKFAEEAGLEGNLESVRELSGDFEKLLNTDSAKGAFNLLMGFIYQHSEELPGIARFCREQKAYFFNRAKEYGITFPREILLQAPKRKKLPR